MSNIKSVYSKSAGREVKLALIKTSSGQSAWVAAEYAPQFQGFINDLEATGYKINSLGGYADRHNVNSSKNASKHAFGYSIDINPAKNGNFRGVSKAERAKNPSKYTDMPIEQVQSLIKKWGLGWGFNWNSISDAMHFSVAENEGGKYLGLDKGGKPNEVATPQTAQTTPTTPTTSTSVTPTQVEVPSTSLMTPTTPNYIENPFAVLTTNPMESTNVMTQGIDTWGQSQGLMQQAPTTQNNGASNNLFSYNPIQNGIAQLFGAV